MTERTGAGKVVSMEMGEAPLGLRDEGVGFEIERRSKLTHGNVLLEGGGEDGGGDVDLRM